MNNRHADLIAIANADLAEKLTRGKKGKPNPSTLKRSQTSNAQKSTSSPNLSFIENAEQATGAETVGNARPSFQQDVWRAVYALNIFRYGLGLLLLILVTASSLDSRWQVLESLIHPKLFFVCALLILCSAILFSYLSRQRKIDFNLLIAVQFSLDVILAGLLTHATSSVSSNFVLIYLIVVATGSVVLPRIQALALASGATIVLILEHVVSVWLSHTNIDENYSLLATYGIVLMAVSLLVAYLAERIRIAELRSFVPGNESIEEFLVREEVNALKAALESTQGNKTEAAKLLGMTFRSFRYKLTKYDIG